MRHDRLHYDTENHFRRHIEADLARDSSVDRARITADTERFLASGGQIEKIPQGTSGYRRWTLQESVNKEADAKRERERHRGK